jgi:hypothetical protein
MAVAAFISAPENSTLYNNVEYWVSPTGDDTAAGTALFPWRTYARAAAEMNKYNEFADGVVAIVNFAAGSYTGGNTNYLKNIRLGVGSYIAFRGSAYTSLLGTTTMQAGTDNAFSMPSTGTELAYEARITVTGPLTVDAYQGKMLRVTSGAASGYRYTIASNTSTVLRMANVTRSVSSPPALFVAGDTFVIEEPAATVDKLIAYDVNGEGCGVVFMNLKCSNYTWAKGSTVFLLGVDGGAVYVDSTDLLGYLYTGNLLWDANNPLLALLGASPSGVVWYGWTNWGASFTLFYAQACGESNLNAVVNTGGTLVGGQGSAGSQLFLRGGLMKGTLTALEDGVLTVFGGGARTRLEVTDIGVNVRAGRVYLTAVEIVATLPIPGQGYLILVERGSYVSIGGYANNRFGCRGSGPSCGVGLQMSGGTQVVTNTALDLTCMTVDNEWFMRSVSEAGLHGASVDLPPSTEIRALNGASLTRIQ